MGSRLKIYSYAILVACTIVVMIAYDSSDVVYDIKKNADWIVLALVITEACFIAGIVIMSFAVFKTIRNPFRQRGQLNELVRQGVRTWSFNIGFVLNAIGAIGTSLVLISAATTTLPIYAWSILLLPVIDLFVTVVLRIALIKEIRS